MDIGTIKAPDVLLCGYYGEDNLGDDALLQVLLQELPEHVRPLITARHASAVRRFAPDASVVNRRSLRSVLARIGDVRALVLGGGSLLQDSTSVRSLVYYVLLIVMARCRGRSVILWGQGLGPLKRPISRWMVRLVLPLCSGASWRDQRSFDTARRWAPSLPMQMAPDPVWQLPCRGWIGGRALVLSWRPTTLLTDDGWRVLLQSLAVLARELDAPVRWLAFHQHQDAALLADLVQRDLVPADLSARSSIVVPDRVEAVVDTVQDARLVLPMRLHALILARLVCCPMAALSYDPKVSAAAEMAGVPCTSLHDLPDQDGLLMQWRQAVDQPADPQVVEAIRGRASAHAELLRRML